MTMPKSTTTIPGSGKNVKLPIRYTKALTPGSVILESGSRNGSERSVYSKRKAAGGALLGRHSQPLSIPGKNKSDSESWGKRMPDGTIQSWAHIHREELCSQFEDEDEDFTDGIDDYED